jgi:hypothetical protein
MSLKKEGLIIMFRRHTPETTIFDPVERQIYWLHTWKDIHVLLEEGPNPLVVHDIVTHRKEDQYCRLYTTGVTPRPIPVRPHLPFTPPIINHSQEPFHGKNFFYYLTKVLILQ